eukprot:3310384-Rhodomonas_salina.3
MVVARVERPRAVGGGTGRLAKKSGGRKRTREDRHRGVNGTGWGDGGGEKAKAESEKPEGGWCA